MKKLLLASLLTLAIVPGAKAVDGTLLAAWAATVVLGAATVMCTAQVLGDTYQSGCESRGGTFQYRGNGESWKCYLPTSEQPAPAPVAYGESRVRECVGILLLD